MNGHSSVMGGVTMQCQGVAGREWRLGDEGYDPFRAGAETGPTADDRPSYLPWFLCTSLCADLQTHFPHSGL